MYALSSHQVTSENNMGKILSLTKSTFDIKMMVKSSAIEKKSSQTRCFRVVGLPSTKTNFEKGRIGISKGTPPLFSCKK